MGIPDNIIPATPLAGPKTSTKKARRSGVTDVIYWPVKG